MTALFALGGVALVTHVLLAVLVLHRAPGKTVNQVFALLLWWYATWDSAEMLMLWHGHTLWPIRLLLSAALVLPYLFAHFTALFPSRHREAIILDSGRRRWLLATPLFVVLVLTWFGFMPQQIRIYDRYALLTIGPYMWLVKGVIVGYMLLALWSLSRSARKAVTEYQIKRLRYTIVGLLLPAAAGSLFVLFGRWFMAGPGVIFYPYGVFPFFGIIMAVVLGYAILRYNLLGVDALICLGLVYTLLTGILAAILELLENGLQNVLQLPGLVSTIIITLVIAAVFAPLRDLFHGLVNRVFGRRTIDVPTVMREILGAMHRANSRHGVLQEMLAATQPILRFQSAAVQLRDGTLLAWPDANPTNSGMPPAGPGATTTPPAVPPAVPPAIPLPLPSGTPLPLDWPDIDDLDALVENCSEENRTDLLASFQPWKDAGFRHVIPVRATDACLGAIFFGAKATRLPYEAAELSLAATVAAEIARALENVDLVAQLVARDRDVQELRWARRIYERLLPDPDIRLIGEFSLRFSCRLAPRIKGDLLDIWSHEHGTLIALNDAFHYGIQAASTLQLARSSLRVCGADATLPDHAAAIDTAIATLQDNTLGIAVTLVTLADPQLQLLNAGNPPPLLFAAGRVEALGPATRPLGQQPAQDVPAGPAPALVPPSRYTTELTLAPTSLLLLATNGVTKALGEHGAAQLSDLLAQHAPAGLDAVHDALCRATTADPASAPAGTNAQNDDVTWILIGRHP